MLACWARCPALHRYFLLEIVRGMKLEARVRIELTIEVLQTSALPLGDRAR